jgi:uncharacterized protein
VRVKRYDRITPNTKLKKENTMAINYSAIQNALQEFVTSVSNVQGASIMSPDGLAIASSLPANMEEDRVAAMSAAMLALGERIGRELARGTIQRVVVEGDKGFATVAACTADAVLVCWLMRKSS